MPHRRFLYSGGRRSLTSDTLTDAIATALAALAIFATAFVNWRAARRAAKAARNAERAASEAALNAQKAAEAARQLIVTAQENGQARSYLRGQRRDARHYQQLALALTLAAHA